MQRTEQTLIAAALVLVGAAIGAGALAVTSDAPRTNTTGTQETGDMSWVPSLASNDSDETVTRFTSEQEFATYVQRGQTLAQQDGGFRGQIMVGRPTVDVEPRWQRRGVRDTTVVATEAATQSDAAAESGAGGAGDASQPDRVSQTNIQELGLHEPDILKTNGNQVFYAPRQMGRWSDRHSPAVYDDTHVISSKTPAQPEEIAEIESSGKLFLSDDKLVVIEEDELVGYDVSNPENPTQTWRHPLDSDVVTARLYQGQMYLVTQSQVALDDPCPIEPLKGEATVDCTDIYHPAKQVPVDATYSAMRIDPATGSVDDSTSFVGTAERTAVYMSENALYVTYTQQPSRGQLRIDYLLKQQRDRLPSWVETRLTEINGYNISGQAKQSEANRVLQQWYSTLEDDKRADIQDDIRDEYQEYLKDHQRDLVTTGIVRVPVGSDTDLSVETVGTVPGHPLNQFSLDEHNGTFRITTTIPAAGDADSRNDLYVLDSETLEQKGAAKNMGVTERVYSVRYVGDTAYVVTFRRIDPFHVVDLSNPSDPEEVGELKLPGFSSYLHPVDENHVLGIGKENGEVKAVLFDVSDPSNPTIDDDYILDSRWSAISQSHHAFLMDKEHGVFFLPTGEGGKIIDYTDGDLSLKTSVDTDGNALRAMYINDYMYVFGESELAVVNENTWERKTTVELD